MSKPSSLERTTTPRPWVRYWARSFDFALYYLITLFIVFPVVISSGWGLFFTPIYMAVMFGVFFLAIVIEAIMLSWWGTTPGKWVLQVQVRDHTGEKLTYAQALKRSGDVWFRGLALGIPVINLMALLIAFLSLKKHGESSWDRDSQLAVSHQPISLGRWIFGLTVVLALPLSEFLMNLLYATVTVIVMGVLTLTGFVLMALYQWITALA